MNSKSILAGLLISAGLAQADCNADNCLRGLRNSKVLPSALAFCAEYTQGVYESALPTYASACSSTASRISSACSCLATSTTSSQTTTLATSTITPSPSLDTTTSTASATESTAASTTASAACARISNGDFETTDLSPWDITRGSAPHGKFAQAVPVADNDLFTPLSGDYMLRVPDTWQVNQQVSNLCASDTDWAMHGFYRSVPGTQCTVSVCAVNWDTFEQSPDCISFTPPEDEWQAVKISMPGSGAGGNWLIQSGVSCYDSNPGAIFVDFVVLA